jgi:hypothetical protein
MAATKSLGREIQSHLDSLGWSQRKLAAQSGIASIAI